jgi:mono/diheme cytochrome c family protein
VLLVGFLLPGTLPAEAKLEQFFAQNCVKCHGPEKQKGKVRLDKAAGALFADKELLETIAIVLEAGEMPPEEEPQPKAKAVAEVMQLLQKHILTQRPVNPLKRLTRAEYTNTIRRTC